jgi:hypothetical protein
MGAASMYPGCPENIPRKSPGEIETREQLLKFCGCRLTTESLISRDAFLQYKSNKYGPVLTRMTLNNITENMCI